MTYRKMENFVACVVTCVNHARTNSLCFQIWYLSKLNIYTNAVNAHYTFQLLMSFCKNTQMSFFRQYDMKLKERCHNIHFSDYPEIEGNLKIIVF